LSATLTSDVNESECIDDKGEDDVLCDPLSRHVNDVGSEMFRDAGEVVSVQQIQDNKAQNSWDQATKSSTMLKNAKVKKSHACHVCYKTFESSGRLERHKHFHAGLKTHKCDLCHKSYTHKGNLKKHKRSHTHIHGNDKPHKCDVCHKRFTTHRSLKRHTFTHTVEKPHKCEACNMQFAD